MNTLNDSGTDDLHSALSLNASPELKLTDHTCSTFYIYWDIILKLWASGKESGGDDHDGGVCKGAMERWTLLLNSRVHLFHLLQHLGLSQNVAVGNASRQSYSVFII